MKKLDELWRDFLTKPFPEGYEEVEVEDMSLEFVDSIAGGSTSDFMRTGRLDLNRIRLLEGCDKRLRMITPRLEGEAKDYFEQLLAIVEMVLQSVK